MRICFTSVVIWPNKKVADKPKIFEKIDNPNYDYFLFSNLKQEDFDTSWKVITVDIDFLKNHRNDIIRSRYFKFMGWKYIKEVLRIDYDIIYFCDATRSPDPNTNWEELSENILLHPHQIGQRVHNSSPYEECKNIVKFRKDTQKNADKTVEWLKEMGVPENKTLCYENTAFGYNPNSEFIQNIFSEFWNIYTTTDITHRDQPSWSYVVWKNGVKPYIIDNSGNRKKINKMFPEGGKQGNNSHRYA